MAEFRPHLSILSGMPLASWLFVRDSASIWVERPYGCTVIVAGPGSSREQRDFISEEALNAYQIALAERLANDGWLLWPHNLDRRSGQDRRQARRGGVDRRGSAFRAATL